jgi:hypothetical protein
LCFGRLLSALHPQSSTLDTFISSYIDIYQPVYPPLKKSSHTLPRPLQSRSQPFPHQHRTKINHALPNALPKNKDNTEALPSTPTTPSPNPNPLSPNQRHDHHHHLEPHRTRVPHLVQTLLHNLLLASRSLDEFPKGDGNELARGTRGGTRLDRVPLSILRIDVDLFFPASTQSAPTRSRPLQSPNPRTPPAPHENNSMPYPIRYPPKKGNDTNNPPPSYYRLVHLVRHDQRTPPPLPGLFHQPPLAPLEFVLFPTGPKRLHISAAQKSHAVPDALPTNKENTKPPSTATATAPSTPLHPR